MTALIIWAVVIVALLLMWFLPGRRSRRWTGRPGSTEGLPSDASVRSGELGRAAGYGEFIDGGGSGPGA